MKIMALTNPEELSDAAETIFKNAQTDPEAKALFDQLLADPNADRATLLATAFCMGVCSALSEMLQGRIIKIEQSGIPQSDS